jgi:hypothetical protein
LNVSTRSRPQPEEQETAAKPRVVPGRASKTAIAHAKELIEKHGLQRLLHPKR